MGATNFTRLHLGFSFGLRPDSSPGPVNETIAGGIKDCASDDAFVGVQWEIAAALDGSGLGWDAVAATPLIAPEDLTDAAQIVERLANPRHAAEEQIARRMRIPIGNAPDLVTGLNNLLDDPILYVGCRSAGVNLASLERPKKGRTWCESRALPEGDGRLHPLQARRVNRFILEKVFSNGMRAHAYLNTPVVAKELLGRFEVAAKSGTFIRKIAVFCHPLHLSWCAYNVASVVEDMAERTVFAADVHKAATEIKAEFDRCRDAGINPVPAATLGLAAATVPIFWGPSSRGGSPDPDSPCWWDEQSSQEWTRNRRDYEAYNAS